MATDSVRGDALANGVATGKGYEFTDSMWETATEKWAREAVERGYPDWDAVPDPDPIEDGMRQEETVTAVRILLRTYFPNMPDVLVAGSGYLAWDKADISAKLVPDCVVAFGVPADEIRARNAYLVWEVGKPLDLALEVATPSTKEDDLTVKRDIYAELGISEYWRVDPTGGDLYGEPIAGEYPADGEYRRYEIHDDREGRVWGHSRLLGINLIWDGSKGRFITQAPRGGRYRIGILETEQERDAALARATAAEARVRELEAEIARLRGRG